MDASLWFTQAKADLESADYDMHPMAGKPAYEWVCYKCYRVIFKKTFLCYDQNIKVTFHLI
jgi:hypothetical protein